MIFNYIRVSTREQNVERQLQGVNCDREYIDKASGKSKDRPQLKAMLDNIREGDIVNVDSTDRLGRNIKDLLEIIETIVEKGAEIRFREENIVINKQEDNFVGTLILTVLGIVAEFVRRKSLENQRRGIAIAKDKGKYQGRGRKLSKEQIVELKEMRNNGASVATISRRFKIVRQSVYNYFKIIKEKNKQEPE